MNKNDLTIIILAAGKGTRMKSDLPKVLHKVAGLEMVRWVIKTAESLNPSHIIVVSGPDMPELEEAAKPHGTAIQEVRNGTGGAVKAALPHIKKPDSDVVILLGDAPLIQKETIENLVVAKQNGQASLSVLGAQLDDPTGYGRLIENNEGFLEHIVEEKDANDEQRLIDIVNTGAFCVSGKDLESWLDQLQSNNAQNELYFTDIPAIAAKDGHKTAICVTDNQDEILGCNSRTDLAILESIMQERLRLNALEKGVTMIDPASVFLSHDTRIEQDVTIEPNVFFGSGVHVESGVHIKAFCHIEGAKIGRDTVLGPMARLRPGADIGENVKIGNFVEIKKASIGQNSKISHLAYIGDTEMGQNVNFSCGAITVNYDGFDKFKTKIGDNVMIGSNVSLIAPIEIESGAFVAAGSTISKDVPADALSIERNQPQTRAGWASDFRKQKAKN